MNLSEIKKQNKMAHELNTICSSLQSVMNNLDGPSAPKRQAEYLALGHQAISRLKKVCDSLNVQILQSTKPIDSHFNQERQTSHADSF